MDDQEFYVRYYTGHTGKYGHEFLEFEFNANGLFRYANHSQYREEKDVIKKEERVHPAVIEEVRRIIEVSEVMKENDEKWPRPNVVGKQELEVRIGNEHISFETSKIESIANVEESEDPDGLRAFHYLVQDLRVFVIALISFHWKASRANVIN